MRRFATIVLSICFLWAVPLTTGSHLSAQEEESKVALEELRKENAELKKLVEDLRLELQQVRLEMREATKIAETRAKEARKKADKEARKMLDELQAAQEKESLQQAETKYTAAEAVLKQNLDRLLSQMEEQVLPQAQEKLKAGEEALKKAIEQLQAIKEKEVLPRAEQKYKMAEEALQKALEQIRMEKSKQLLRKDEVAKALKHYEEAFRKTTPKQLADLLKERMQYEIRKDQVVERKAKDIEKAILSRDDAGVLTQLRLEKVRLCRELGKTDEAIAELKKIIEEDLDKETTVAARWMLIEILQEQKQTEAAMQMLKEILATSKDPEQRRNAFYAIIQMAGENPEAKLRATEQVIKWLEGTVEETREKAWRAACMNNLKQLMLGIKTWSPDHDEKFPEKLSDLYPNYTPSLDVFTCPSAGGPKITKKEEIDSKTSYIYRTGLTEAAHSDAVVIYEDPSNHGGEGGYIAFADGHVEWLDANKLKEIVARGRKEKTAESQRR